MLLGEVPAMQAEGRQDPTAAGGIGLGAAPCCCHLPHLVPLPCWGQCITLKWKTHRSASECGTELGDARVNGRRLWVPGGPGSSLGSHKGLFLLQNWNCWCGMGSVAHWNSWEQLSLNWGHILKTWDLSCGPHGLCTALSAPVSTLSIASPGLEISFPKILCET